MVETNNGLDAIRDFLSGDISNILIGTDATAPSKTDTALGNQVASKAATPDDGGVGEVTHEATLTTSENNGDTLREAGGENDAGELESHLVHSDLDKTSSIEVVYRLKHTVRNP